MRKCATIVAMLACVVYTTLTAWHGVLMQTARTQGTTQEALLQQALGTAICHGDGTEQASIPDTAPQPGPANQSNFCPVCKGLASCHLILLVTAELGPLTFLVAVRYLPHEEAGTDRAGITPRSRGPPPPV